LGHEKKNSVMTSPHADTTVVARLTIDGPTAAHIQDALAEHFGEGVAISIGQESEDAPDRRWSLTLHFRDRPDEGMVRALIASIAGQPSGEERARRLAQDVRFETLAPADWVRKSLEGLTPVEAGRFVVHGAHHRGRFPANRIAIQIDAGLAFGTGHHGSTRGCLLALDGIVKWTNRRPVGWAKSSAVIYPRGHGARAILPTRMDRWTRALAHPTNKRQKTTIVLDLGTGTGVLAIAATKALRRPVLASDIDGRAVRIARDNARINAVAGSIEVVHAAGIGARRLRARAPFDLVLANILLEPLQQFATTIARLVAPHGHVVLSGLLNAQARAALATYGTRGFSLRQRITLGGWTTLVVTRRGRV
jgi:ribosomal protein L11 methyltransferase